jgi:cell division septation protein DedD
MKFVSFLILMFALLLFVSGCSKDEEIAELESEVMGDQTADLTEETAEEVVDTATQYASTPETAPEEEVGPEYEMPMRPEFSGFTVQVSSSTNYENTRLLVELYQQRGYDPFVTEADIDGELFYRVRLGAFETYEQANALGLELKDKYSAKYWIASN